MILWTVERECFYEESIKKGVIFTDPELLDKEFMPAYKWLAKQMVLQNKSKKEIIPNWTWYKYAGEHKKPDMRCLRHFSRKESIRIEFECDEREVLLVQEPGWLCVLGNHFFAYDEKEDEKIESIDNNQVKQKEIIRSWDRIFDLEFGSDEDWGKLQERNVFAFVPYIKTSQIKKTWKVKGVW